MIQRPGYYNPYRHPDRAARPPQPGALADAAERATSDDREYALAVEAPLNLAKRRGPIAGCALFRGPGERFAAKPVSGSRLPGQFASAFTPRSICDLQRAAGEAIRDGMQGVDEQIRKQRRFKGQTFPKRNAR